MWHGRKKVVKEELTEKQLAEINAKLDKIKRNNSILL